MHEIVRWTEWDGTGLEHLVLKSHEAGFRADSVVIGGRGDSPYGARYQVSCDTRWRTREVRLDYIGTHSMHVATDGDGHWFDMLAGQQPIPELDGCFDVDIGVTPLTNTLPIKRLGLSGGASKQIRAAYVPLPSQIKNQRLLPEPADQRYTCLEENQLYRYEGLFRSFSADLAVDAYGLVKDYPETFRRLG